MNREPFSYYTSSSFTRSLCSPSRRTKRIIDDPFMAEYSRYDHNQFYKIPPKMSHLNFHPKFLYKNCQKKPFLGCFLSEENLIL